MQITEKEKRLIQEINHPVYTVDFMEEWINRNDRVDINAPAALKAMGAKGYYAAIQQILKYYSADLIPQESKDLYDENALEKEQ